MPETTLRHLELTRDAGVATVRFNRPDALNALNHAMATEFRDVVLELAGDSSVRAVLIAGAGRGFCSGADLKDPDTLKLPDGRPDLGGTLREIYNPAILALRAMDKPVVAAVHGGAVGVGCSIALACDLVVAARSAYFLLAFVNVGLVLDGGASALLEARMGFARASAMALLGERVSAADALAWGLINDLVEDERLGETGAALARRLADGPPQATAAIKRMLNERVFRGLADALALEADLQGRAGEGSEVIEGITAFVEKRPARFSD